MARPLLLIALAALAACTPTTYAPDGGGQVLDADHGQWLSMVPGPDGSLAATFHDRTNGGLVFAVGTPGEGDRVSWTYEEVDGYPDENGLNPGVIGTHTSVAIAPDGTAWVAYNNPANEELRVAHRTAPGTWVVEIVDPKTPAASPGPWASLALDDDGLPYVAYQDAKQKVLRLARRADDGTWSTETVFEGEAVVVPPEGDDTAAEPEERPADVGGFARLLVDGKLLFLAFHDAANGSLNLLEGRADNLQHTVVDGADVAVDVGTWPSLLLDEGTLHIAYHDVTNQDLKLATRTSSSFSIQVVDDGPWVGADTEVHQTASGALAVLYFDGKGNRMRRAVKSGASWTITDLGRDGSATGFHNEVARVRGGDLWAASYDPTQKRLYTRRLTE